MWTPFRGLSHQETPRPMVLLATAPLIPAPRWPPKCRVGILICGLARPTRWGEVGYSPEWWHQYIHPELWAAWFPTSSLVTFRMIVYGNTSHLTGITLTPDDKSTQEYSVSSGVWLSSTIKLGVLRNQNFRTSGCPICWVQSGTFSTTN